MNKLVLILCLAPSMAYGNWEKVISCNNDVMEIDKECGFVGQFPETYKCDYQMVIRNNEIVEYLQVKELSSSTWNGSEWVGEVAPENGYGRFTMKSYLDPSYIRISPLHDGLKVQTYRPVYRSQTYPAKNWKFEKCNLVESY